MTRTERWGQPVAAVLLGVSAAMLIFSVASLLLPGVEQMPDRPTVPIAIAAISVFASFPLVGWLIATRRPDNPIGWLFLAVGLIFSVGFFATDYVWRALLFDLPLPGVALVAWIGDWSFLLALGLTFTWLPLLFPTGLLPGPFWKLVLWASGITIALGVGAAAIRPRPLDSFDGVLDPLIMAPASMDGILMFLEETYLVVGFGLGALALASLIVRFRRAGRIERQQLKWFGLANGAFIGIIATAFLTFIEGLFALALLAAACIPISAGIAILRYRLFDIDRIISRTIGWTIVSASLVAVFAFAVVALQTLLVDVTQGRTLAVAASTLVAFALFQPIRRRVQTGVDRRFDRARYDAQRTVDAFAEALRDEVDLVRLRSSLLGAASDAVLPATGDVWIRPEVPR